MKRALSIMAVIALGMTACNKIDVEISAEENAPEAVSYSVSIPANYGGAGTKAVAEGDAGKLASTFRTTDIISVYWNNIQANDGIGDPIFLHTDTDGKTANLTGTLTFHEYVSDGDGTVWVPQELSVGDNLLLIYNADGIIDYSLEPQTGTLAGLSSYDFAVADVQITAKSGDKESGYTLTTTDANFVNCQSMYKFTFTGLPVGVGVKSVTISSAGNHLQDRYYPYTGACDHNPITITLDNAGRTANGSGVVYTALRLDALAVDATDDITFIVTGTDEKTYAAKKTSPAGGFKNGKYYTSTIALTTPVYYIATSSDIGKVIGSDGNIYNTVDDVWAAGANAIAMIAFAGNVDGVCNHGLAISLTDAYAYNATFAEATGDVIISSWESGHAITGGTWRLPTEEDWQYMMWGYYAVNPVAQNISTFNTKLDNVGTALVSEENYWTSTTVDADNAKVVYYDGTYAGINNSVKNQYCHVRACLAF